jgi:beta,beta-carotene 9',10'-dioxygenase
VKLQVHTGEKPALDRSGRISQPTICVADFTRSGEDGVLLSVDAASQNSPPLVLGAETIHERARARVPHHIAFGIHGESYADEQG